MCHFSTYFAIIIYFLKINSWKGKKGESKAGWGAPSTPGLRATLCNILFDWTIIIFSHHFIISIQLVDVVIYNMSLIPIHEAFNIALRVPPKVGRFGLSAAAAVRFKNGTNPPVANIVTRRVLQKFGSDAILAFISPALKSTNQNFAIRRFFRYTS